MVVTPYIFDGGALTGSAVTQGSIVPALTKRIIKSAVLTNTTGAPIAATVYLVPSGGTAGSTNTYISARPIAAGDSYPCPELINQGLNAGGFVQALGNGLTFKYTATEFV
jgi:hypothetical protein